MSKKDHGPYSKICLAIKDINGGKRDYFGSRELIKELKKQDKLNSTFDEKGITNNLESLLKEFITVLENPKLEKYKYFRKYWLYNTNNFTLCYKRYIYELGAYFCDEKEITEKEEKSFYNFPLFFKKACTKFNIEPYASMDEEELNIFLNNYLDLSNKDLFHPNLTHSRKTTHDSRFVERTIYNSITSKKAWLVSKNGDGYGYDILVFDKSNEKEKLIEVKTCYDDDKFRLSRLEHKIMLESSDLPNTEYFIYKYKYSNNSLYAYRYDKEHNILVDINDENHICIIEGYMDYERERRIPMAPRIKFMCTPKYLGKDKSLLYK